MTYQAPIHRPDALRTLRVRPARRAQVNPLPAGAGNMTVLVDGNSFANGHSPLPSDRLEIMRKPRKLVFDRDRLDQVGAQATPFLHDLRKNDRARSSAASRAFLTDSHSGDPFPMGRIDLQETLKYMQACYGPAGTPT